MQLRQIKIFECLVKRPQPQCRAAMTLGTDHAWKNPKLDKLSEVLIRVIKGFECSTNSAHGTHSLEHQAENYLVKNPNCQSSQVFTTLVHDGFKCLSP
jgi:hypothetical protein